MSQLSTLLDTAKAGRLPACGSCAWNPTRVGKMAFGTSCVEHTHTADGPALVVAIAQDPGGTTPEKTSRLCVVCNSQNRTDQSAIHAFDLWRAAISMAPQTHPYADPLMKRTYFTNALLHGVPTQDERAPEARERLQAMRRLALTACADVLRDQLTLLQPRVLMVSGDAAIQALAQISPGDWNEPTGTSPAQRSVHLPGVAHRATTFRLIHAGARGTNGRAAELARTFFPTTEQQVESMREHIRKLPSQQQALSFLDKYRAKGSTDTTFRGMMLHLSWWMAVGFAVRAAAES
jgi:Uracil DNA glycosylase superfamily